MECGVVGFHSEAACGFRRLRCVRWNSVLGHSCHSALQTLGPGYLEATAPRHHLFCGVPHLVAGRPEGPLGCALSSHCTDVSPIQSPGPGDGRGGALALSLALSVGEPETRGSAPGGCSFQVACLHQALPRDASLGSLEGRGMWYGCRVVAGSAVG